MPIITPDTSSQLEFKPLEPGTYPAKITDVQYGTSKSSGNPMLTVTMDVNAEGRAVPRKAFLVITGEGSYGFDQLLRACRMDQLADAYKDKSAEKPPFDTDELIGQEINVIVEHETYNNQLRDRVKTFLRA